MSEQVPTVMTILEGPLLTEIYHPYFHGKVKDGEKNHDGTPKDGEANFEEKQKVLKGEIPLPSESRIMLDLNNMPHDSEPVYWPTWTFKLYTRDGQLMSVDTIVGKDGSKGQDEGEFVRVQAAERPSGVWQRSRGYRGIFILGGTDFNKGKLEVTAEVGGILGDTLTFPVVSHK